ncbi:MAG: type II toxin-antitoxin system RelE/ParE family toxin [Thermodesulfobacteriota bacterium]
MAAQRLVEIADFIAADDPAAAAAWVQGLRERLKRLVHFPGSARVVPELGKPEYRELIYGDYRVMYRIGSNIVEILTIRHAKRRMDPGELGH